MILFVSLKDNGGLMHLHLKTQEDVFTKLSSRQGLSVIDLFNDNGLIGLQAIRLLHWYMIDPTDTKEKCLCL
jgi:hypothetical protein